MSTSNENVGNSSLSGLLSESVLHGGAISALVELDEAEFDTLGSEGVLGFAGEWAGGLGEDHDLVGSDQLIDLGGEVSLSHFVECVICINQKLDYRFAFHFQTK